MNPLVGHVEAEKLLECLTTWDRLTAAEADAIRSEDWSAMERAQAAKRDLQTVLDAILAPVGRISAADRWGNGELKAKVFEWVLKLKVSERENAAALDRKLAGKRHGMAELDHAARNLRQVQKAYGHGGTAAWQSYS